MCFSGNMLASPPPPGFVGRISEWIGKKKKILRGSCIAIAIKNDDGKLHVDVGTSVTEVHGSFRKIPSWKLKEICMCMRRHLTCGIVFW